EHVAAFGDRNFEVVYVAAGDSRENFAGCGWLVESILAGLKFRVRMEGSFDPELPGVADDSGLRESFADFFRRGSAVDFDEGFVGEALIGGGEEIEADYGESEKQG